MYLSVWLWLIFLAAFLIVGLKKQNYKIIKLPSQKNSSVVSISNAVVESWPQNQDKFFSKKETISISFFYAILGNQNLEISCLSISIMSKGYRLSETLSHIVDRNRYLIWFKI